MTSCRFAAITSLALFAAGSACLAQAGSIAMAGSDSATFAAVREVWAADLASKTGRFAANAGTPSTLWLASEQARWPMYDLAGFYIPNDAVPHVLSVRPTAGAEQFEILTRFDSPGDSASNSSLTVAVEAVTVDNRLVLMNALRRNTVDWSRERAGPIEYFVQPGQTFNRSRANRASAFVDSLADALQVPRPASIEYYVTASVDDALMIMGVRPTVRYGSNGGFSKPVNHQVFSGNPAIGEDYRHELTHVVVLPLLANSTTTLLASEGFATWLGGTEGQDFRASVRRLSTYLTDHPTVTLDSAVDSTTLPQWVRYTSGAVLCEMLSGSGGTAALKEFLVADSWQIRDVVSHRLAQSWASIVEQWRRVIDHLAST